jgi:ABC-type phosphate transport system substrate-binding protein
MAIIYHIDGIGVDSPRLNLDLNLVAAIYLGQIKYWNDSQIVAANPLLGSLLPPSIISVARRADIAGNITVDTISSLATTEELGKALSRVSSDWRTIVGTPSATPNWPVGPQWFPTVALKGMIAGIQQVKLSVSSSLIEP